ncbi:MAG: nuclear transport factor 2 family protein [Pseudomonadota bacterium]
MRHLLVGPIATALLAFAISSPFASAQLVDSSAVTVATQSTTDASENDPFAPPTRAWEQGSIYPNSIPASFETHILAETEKELEIARRVIEIYDLFIEGPTNENLSGLISDEYIQHSVFLPNGRAPLAELFGSSAEQYPVKIDIHRVIVSGNYAFAHVNFRNLETGDPRDLGIAAVDMYRFDEETGLLEEHWDVLQNVPSHSPNPNGMFLLAK